MYTATSWNGNDNILDTDETARTEWDPKLTPPGDFGLHKFYPQQPGPFMATQTIEVFSTSIYDAYKKYSDDLSTTYNAEKVLYDELKLLYNEKKQLELKRNSDILRGIFELEYLIPQKPCKPVRPPAYAGPVFSFTQTDWDDSSTAGNNQFKIDNKVILSEVAVASTAGSSFAPKKRTLRTGFMQANSAASGTITPQWVGHVFGRMGQGARTTPEETDFQAPFMWEASTGNVGMMVSLLPIQQSSSGLNAAQFVKLTGKIEAWYDKT